MAFVVPKPADATVVRGLSLSDLVRASDRVLVVTPLDAESRFERTARGRRIVTFVRVRVEEAWIGNEPAPSELLVKIYGGRVGKQAELVIGQPELSLGERSLLFLMTRPDGSAVVTGMAQGQYRLLPDASRTLRLSPPEGLERLVRVRASAVSSLIGLEPSAARAAVLAATR